MECQTNSKKYKDLKNYILQEQQQQQNNSNNNMNWSENRD